MAPVTMDCPALQTGLSLSLSLSLPKLPPSPPSEFDSDSPTLDIAVFDKKYKGNDNESMGLRTPTSASSPDYDFDHDSNEDDTLAKIQTKLEYLWSLYNSGKALFPRHLLEDLDRQISSGNSDVQIEDLDGNSNNYSLQVPGWCKDVATTYRIGYSSIQDLTCIHPAFPELSLRDNSPLSICYTSCTEIYPPSPLTDVERKFDKCKAAWESSETCSALLRNLGDLRKRGKITKDVRKIVGFGLGSLSYLNDEFHCVRAHAQHAAVKAMARALEDSVGGYDREGKEIEHHNGAGNEIGCPNAHRDIRVDRDSVNATLSNGHTAGINHDKNNKGSTSAIKCYAQDPAYNDVDMALLRSIGIEPLDDPKGFLEIDEHTLIFSVSPNVPVKQIVADVALPRAMIWNTVALEDEDTQWEKKERDGEEFWVVPFTTDPDSQRVRGMVQHFSSVPLRDSDEYFGDLTIYVR